MDSVNTDADFELICYLAKEKKYMDCKQVTLQLLNAMEGTANPPTRVREITGLVDANLLRAQTIRICHALVKRMDMHLRSGQTETSSWKCEGGSPLPCSPIYRSRNQPALLGGPTRAYTTTRNVAV